MFGMEDLREQDVEMAKAISNYLNGSSNKQQFCRAMNREHRFLQQQFTGLCLEWLRYCASRDFQYDGRNEYSRIVAKTMIEKGVL